MEVRSMLNGVIRDCLGTSMESKIFWEGENFEQKTLSYLIKTLKLVVRQYGIYPKILIIKVYGMQNG